MAEASRYPDGSSSLTGSAPARSRQVDPSWGWLVVGGLALVAVAASCLLWIDQNPDPRDWDNAEYVNMVTHDYYAYHRHGLPGVMRSLGTVDPARPPGYRIVVLPVTLWAGPSVLSLRLLSLVLLGIVAAMVYATVSRPGGRAAGILAAALVTSLPVVHQSMRIFMTETALYPALVATVLFVIVGLYQGRVRWPVWVGLGASLGLGLLAKVTFVVIGGSIMVTAVSLAWAGGLGGWRLWQLGSAAALGAIIAGPIYARNAPAILASAAEAAYFVRHGYDSWSWANTMDWLSRIGTLGFGRGAVMRLATLVAASMAVAARRLWRGEPVGFGPRAAAAAGVCLAAGLPLMASQVLMTITWTIRHISPAYIAVTMAVCIAAGAMGVFQSRLLLMVAVGLLSVQVWTGATEAFASRRDVWDWDRLYLAIQPHADPIRIVHLGNGTSFNPPVHSGTMGPAGPADRRAVAVAVREGADRLGPDRAGPRGGRRGVDRARIRR
jgi:4-amino-4-deoxy-L-arabinose transferase-like glycosyltransferase